MTPSSYRIPNRFYSQRKPSLWVWICQQNASCSMELSNTRMEGDVSYKQPSMHFSTAMRSRYIQMSGRAGRRGLDKKGTVIIANYKRIMPIQVWLYFLEWLCCSHLKMWFKECKQRSSQSLDWITPCCWTSYEARICPLKAWFNNPSPRSKNKEILKSMIWKMYLFFPHTRPTRSWIP